MPRPKPVLTDDQIDELEKMAGVGLTIDQIAPLLDLAPATLERIMRRDQAVRDAIKKGRSKAIFTVGKSAYQQAISGKVPAMTMFYLKCRAGWKEIQAVEHSGPDGKPIQSETKHSDLTDAQIDAKIQKLLEKVSK